MRTKYSRYIVFEKQSLGCSGGGVFVHGNAQYPKLYTYKELISVKKNPDIFTILPVQVTKDQIEYQKRRVVEEA